MSSPRKEFLSCLLYFEAVLFLSIALLWNGAGKSFEELTFIRRGEPVGVSQTESEWWLRHSALAAVWMLVACSVLWTFFKPLRNSWNRLEGPKIARDDESE